MGSEDVFGGNTELKQPELPLQTCEGQSFIKKYIFAFIPSEQ